MYNDPDGRDPQSVAVVIRGAGRKANDQQGFGGIAKNIGDNLKAKKITVVTVTIQEGWDKAKAEAAVKGAVQGKVARSVTYAGHGVAIDDDAKKKTTGALAVSSVAGKG